MEDNYDMSEYETQLDDTPEMGSEVEETQETLDNPVEDSEQELSLEEKLAKLNDEQPVEGEELSSVDKSILEQVNDLGILRKGLPAQFDSEEQLKEVLSKGYDYTQKTMELAQERENLQEELIEARDYLDNEREEFENYKSHYENELVENQLMVQIINDLQNQDPEIFEELTRRFQEKQGVYRLHENNPAFKQLNEKYQDLESKLTQQHDADSQAEYTAIREEWDNGVNETQTKYNQHLKTLGIKVDWAKVQDHWKKDATSTVTPEQSLMAVYGEQMTKALQARERLAQKKAKVGQLTNTGKATQGQEAPKFREGRGAYDDVNYLQSIYDKVTG